MSIGVKIKRLREKNNWSQPELAYRLGISQTTLCNIESDKCKKIDFLLVVKVCQEFDVTFDYFLKNKKSSQKGCVE
ncbi:helix-turn-helix domain-containing protein [Flavobacterium aquiphilum]|uniref:helix-turn-helix domain-containing protein n=1 Tax=Flavobacterium aquiphilum TaxID=3003261 RepID=UPI00247FD81B|nr:helix-turn-helix transcriptional regulator [Flavobacterium aquiphilum]